MTTHVRSYLYHITTLVYNTIEQLRISLYYTSLIKPLDTTCKKPVQNMFIGGSVRPEKSRDKEDLTLTLAGHFNINFYETC